MFEKTETKSKLKLSDKKKTEDAFESTIQCCWQVQEKAQKVCEKVTVVMQGHQ